MFSIFKKKERATVYALRLFDLHKFRVAYIIFNEMGIEMDVIIGEYGAMREKYPRAVGLGFQSVEITSNAYEEYVNRARMFVRANKSLL